MADKEHVPETKDVKRNREQRRHPEKLERPQDEAPSRAAEAPDDLVEQDVASVRAKNSGHRKKTADKWNQ